MPTFMCIAYGDRDGHARTSEARRASAYEVDSRLLDRGAAMGVAGDPVQVRDHGGDQLRLDEGAYLESQLPIAGMSCIEAADMDEAVRLVSETPCAACHGVVEIWPLESSASA